MNNIRNILEITLRALKVRHTHSYANRLYDEHPDKDNLYGLSSMLSHYGIENEGVEVADKSSLNEIDLPFIAKVNCSFALVKSISGNMVEYYMNGKLAKDSYDQFLNKWTGIALLIHANTNSGEPNFKKNHREELLQSSVKILFVTVCVIAVLLTIFSSGVWQNTASVLQLAVSAFGLVVSMLLMQKQIFSENNYSDKICSSLFKGNCNDVLESKAAKFFGLFSWSELGFGYFSSLVIILLFFPSLIGYVALIHLCTLPYTFWSVWYQIVKSKQVCPLCLSVVITLWLLLGCFLFNNNYGDISLSNTGVATIVILFLLPFLTTHYAAGYLARAETLKRYFNKMSDLKNNKEVFYSLLSKQLKHEISKGTSSILFGNSEAENLITIVTNPHCEPCAITHSIIDKMLKIDHDKYCIQYLLTSFNKQLNKSNRIIIALYFQSSGEERNKLFAEWFNNGKYDADDFIQKHNLDINEIEVEVEFEKHENWKLSSNIDATPTILFNGFLLSDYYKIEDLWQL